MTGRFFWAEELVFKLESDRYPDKYWLVKVPQVESGTWNLRAILNTKPNRDLMPAEPPKTFKILLVVKERKVVENTISNPHPGWGYFSLKSYDKKNKIAYFGNPFWPEATWAAKMPSTGDGRFTIQAVLTEMN
ncbi:MAG: hypothetical protein AB7E47_12595 [Desulfovibrionaceae bacterium]